MATRLSERLRDVGATVLLAAAVFVPMRVAINRAAGMDLHVTAALIAAAAGIALWRGVLGARPAPHVLDVAMAGFVGWCGLHLLFLGEPHPLAVKGFLVETRFAWIYLVARFLGIGADYGRRFLTLYLVLGVVIGGIGLVEYFVSWGALRDSLGIVGDARYMKMRLPRLYSLVVTPAGVAYFLFGALAAAAALWRSERRPLAVAATVVSWIAIPLTLTRSAIACSVALAFAFPVLRRQAWSFLAISLVCGTLSLFLVPSSSPVSPVVQYAGGATSDKSAAVHRYAFEAGSQALRDRPLGFGLGHAGALTLQAGGLTKVGETYFLILGAQVGIPALVLIVAVLALSGWIGLRAALELDPGRRAAGTFVVAFLFGVTMGSLVLPIGSTAWIQLYLFALVASLLNDQEERQSSIVR